MTMCWFCPELSYVSLNFCVEESILYTLFLCLRKYILHSYKKVGYTIPIKALIDPFRWAWKWGRKRLTEKFTMRWWSLIISSRSGYILILTLVHFCHFTLISKWYANEAAKRIKLMYLSFATTCTLYNRQGYNLSQLTERWTMKFRARNSVPKNHWLFF